MALRDARRARWLLTPVAVTAVLLMLAPAVAQAGQGNSTTPTFPVSATVGENGLDASIEILNRSTSPQSDGTSTICNLGDTGLCAGDEGITVVPSCGQVNQAILACAAADPGVFSIVSTPTGAAGSGCSGILFDVAVADPVFGKLRLTPQGNAHISLAPGASCKIDFKVSVQKLPSVDENPAAEGVQTKQLASSRLVSTAFPTSGQGTGTSFGTTVTPPPPPPPPPCVPPPGPAPPGVPLCALPVVASQSPAPAARIVGRSGCVTQNFYVTVTGEAIRRVTFYLDGRWIRTLTRPNAGSRWRIRVRPGRLRRGTHRIIARTTFTPASGAPVRSLRVVFQRCGRIAGVPKFTG